MKNTGLLFAFAILMVACGAKKYDATSSIEIKKDPCFGFCPVYSFTIDGTGYATFIGERNVEKTRKWTRTLSPEETSSLFQIFENSIFWDFEEEYTDAVTDMPTTWITFKHQGRT